MISLLGSPDHMLRTILDEMDRLSLPSDLECDHICYRVATTDRYQELKESISKFSTLLFEPMIAGRPISIFLLNEPYVYHGRSIRCLEMPAPKQESSYTEGWEHAEFVIPHHDNAPLNSTLEKFMHAHPSLAFDTRTIDKKLNPEIGLKIPPYQIKYHVRDIRDVVELEKQEPGA